MLDVECLRDLYILVEEGCGDGLEGNRSGLKSRPPSQSARRAQTLLRGHVHELRIGVSACCCGCSAVGQTPAALHAACRSPAHVAAGRHRRASQVVDNGRSSIARARRRRPARGRRRRMPIRLAPRRRLGRVSSLKLEAAVIASRVVAEAGSCRDRAVAVTGSRVIASRGRMTESRRDRAVAVSPWLAADRSH